ncbi:MAG: family 16 glycosylhydrolase [Bacteroidia bacterium]|nr:family 16 glycosylhydrolase [Bacteroidia bacterium]
MKFLKKSIFFLGLFILSPLSSIFGQTPLNDPNWIPSPLGISNEFNQPIGSSLPSTWKLFEQTPQNTVFHSFVSCNGGIYAGTDFGVFFLDTIGVTNLHKIDNSWIPKNNGLTNFNINCINNNGSNIFAGSNSGVFLSTDNGNSWIQKGLSTYKIIAIATSGNNIFASTYGYDGVFLSTDNGNSWVDINNGLPETNIQTLTISGNNIFAGTNENGVFLSTNNGSSWTQKGLFGYGITALVVNGSEIFAGTVNNGVFYSANNGSSWSQKGLFGYGITALAINSQNICASTNNDKVFLSFDNGNLWNEIGSNKIVKSIILLGDTNQIVGTNKDAFLFNGVNWIIKNTGINNAVNKINNITFESRTTDPSDTTYLTFTSNWNQTTGQFNSGGIITAWQNDPNNNLDPNYSYRYYSPYGFYESRLIFAPGNNDMWQTFWMYYGGSENTPYGEIDISEKYYALSESESSTNIWYGIPPNNTIQSFGAETFISQSLLTNSFHRYAVDWSPNRLIFYLDGKMIREIYNNSLIPTYKQLVTIGSGPDLPSNYGLGFSPSVRKMYVDYVHAFVLRKDCLTSKTITNIYPFDGFIYQVYNNVTLDCSTLITIPSTAKIAFRATNSILIKGDVIISQGAEFGIYPTNCTENN